MLETHVVKDPVLAASQLVVPALGAHRPATLVAEPKAGFAYRAAVRADAMQIRLGHARSPHRS